MYLGGELTTPGIGFSECGKKDSEVGNRGGSWQLTKEQVAGSTELRGFRLDLWGGFQGTRAAVSNVCLILRKPMAKGGTPYMERFFTR